MPAPASKRLVTKDKFYTVNVKSGLDQYDNDCAWSKLANPSYFTKLKERDELDLELLSKTLMRNNLRNQSEAALETSDTEGQSPLK